MTNDQLRQAILDGCDGALARPILSRFLSARARAVIQAQRSFWAAAPDDQLAKLAAFLPPSFRASGPEVPDDPKIVLAVYACEAAVAALSGDAEQARVMIEGARGCCEALKPSPGQRRDAMQQMTVDHLKACCPPDQVAKLDAAGFDWAKLLAALPQIIALLLSVIGGAPAPAPAPTQP